MKPNIIASKVCEPKRDRQTQSRKGVARATNKSAGHGIAPTNHEPRVIFVRQIWRTRYDPNIQVARAHQQALQETVGTLSQNIGEAVGQAIKPIKEGFLMLQAVAIKHKPSKAQAIADIVHRWALPVVQVLLGAAVVVVGASIMEISIMVLGATMCATGLALCVTLLAGTLAPHPLDSLRDFVKRRQSHDPEFYSPGMMVALDGGG